jgi:hypothetical protein
MTSIDVSFPYDLVFLTLMTNHTFVEEFFEHMFTYTAATHRATVKAVYDMLAGKHNDPNLLLIVEESFVS